MDWYPWYFTLFEQDTMHLNPYQDGCYRRLIDHYMKTRAPLPDNDAALARIIGDSEVNWVAMASPLVRPFFQSRKGRLYLKRCEDILDYQDKKVSKLSESGKKGAEKRWGKIKELDSHPIATPLATLKPIDGTVQDSTLQLHYNTLMYFSEFWEIFPRQRRGNKEKARRAYKRATDRDSEGNILEGLKKYCESDEVANGYGKGAEAWLNDDRWKNDYSTKGKKNGTDPKDELREFLDSRRH